MMQGEQFTVGEHPLASGWFDWKNTGVEKNKKKAVNTV